MTTHNSTPPSVKPRHTLRRIILVIVGVLVVAFIAIQLIPVNRTNPPVAAPLKWDSPQTEALAQRTCMDCHSNETVWPWYSYVAPASWLTYYDVQQGRSRLNLSTLGTAEGAPVNFNNDLAFQLGRSLAGGNQRGGREGGEPFGPPPSGERRGGADPEEIVEQIQNKQMPPANYLTLHPSANLSDAERQQLIQGLTATLGQSGAAGLSAQR